jgi:chromosome segregation ATPase
VDFPPPSSAGAKPSPSFPPPPGFAPPGPSFPAPGGAKSPAKPGGGLKPLVLPRRASPLQRAQEASQATAEARKSIGAIMSQSRPPWGGKPMLSGSQVEELEKALRALEAKVGEREMALAEAETKLAERDRALAETEALLQAREKVIDAMRKQPAVQTGAVNPEEMAALGKLKEELDRQEAAMKEQRAAIKEREEFLEQSEASLFEKMQAQQEQETEIEQQREDLKRAMLKAGLLKEEPKGPMEKA